RSGLAEGERVGVRPWVEEGDLESAVGDGAVLADELVQALLRDRAVAVDVGSVGLAGWLSVDENPESHWASWCRWSQDEVAVEEDHFRGDQSNGSLGSLRASDPDGWPATAARAGQPVRQPSRDRPAQAGAAVDLTLCTDDRQAAGKLPLVCL